MYSLFLYDEVYCNDKMVGHPVKWFRVTGSSPVFITSRKGIVDG